MKNVFISHAGADAAIAKKLHDDLTQAGISVTIDLNSLKLGHNPIDFMNKAIAAADTVLILYSTATPNAKWQMLEIDSALWHNLAQSGGEIIVLRLDSAPLPPLLGPRLFGSLESQNYDKTLKTLLGKTSSPVLPAPIVHSGRPPIPYVKDILTLPNGKQDVTWAVLIHPDNRREIILIGSQSNVHGQIVHRGDDYKGFPQQIEYITPSVKYFYNHQAKAAYYVKDPHTIPQEVSVDVYYAIDPAEMYQGAPRHKIQRTVKNNGGFEDEIFDLKRNEEYRIRIFSSGKRVRIKDNPTPAGWASPGTRKVPFYSI